MNNIKELLNEKQEELFEKKDNLSLILGNRQQYYLGSYRETLIRDWLIEFLNNDNLFTNSNVEVGTGLITNSEGELSKQIDILIYDRKKSEKFRIKEFCIVDISQVIGCIEIKSNLNQADLASNKGALDNIKKLRILERKARGINDPRINYSIFAFSSPQLKSLTKNMKGFYQNNQDEFIKNYVQEFQKRQGILPVATRFTPDLIASIEGVSILFGDQLTQNGYLPSAFISNSKGRDFGIIPLFYSMLLNSISSHYHLENDAVSTIWGFNYDESKQGYSTRNIFNFDWENPIILTQN